MTEFPGFDGNNRPGLTDQATLRRVRFVVQASDDQIVLMEFPDPRPCKALIASTRLNGLLKQPTAADHDALDILTMAQPPQENPTLRNELSSWVGESSHASMVPLIGTVMHGAQVFWRPGRAAILAASERMELLVSALVDFSYYENELRKLEQEVAESWQELELDSALAHEFKPADLERSEALGVRRGKALQRRMRHARIEPHLYRASAHLPLQAQELGERLREKSRIEDRLEVLDSQLEIFERVYEAASQRLSETRTAYQERKLEWVIIVLLAAETLLLLMSVLWSLEG